MPHHTARGPSGRAPAGALRRYLTAAVLVRLADEGARVALVLLAIQRTSSAGAGGLMVAALLAPHVLAAPGVGLLTDRVRQPRWVLAAAPVGFAAALATTAVATGRAPTWMVLAVLLVGGCCGPAMTGALSSQLPTLVAPGSLPRAFGLDSVTYNVSGILGPALAGVLAGLVSPAAAAAVLAASAGCGALVMATVPTGLRERGQAGATPPMSAGVLAVVRDRVLAVVTTASSLGQLGVGALPVVTAVLATRAHAPSDAGWLMTAVAAGALLGSLAWTWRPLAPPQAPKVVMAAMAGTGLAVGLAAATTTSLPATGALFAAAGACTGPFTGALFTTRNDHAPEHLRAQVFTLGAGLKTTTAAAGAALAGLVTHAPTATQLLLAAGCLLLAAGLGALALPHAGPAQAPPGLVASGHPGGLCSPPPGAGQAGRGEHGAGGLGDR
jgi:MFS family permease